MARFFWIFAFVVLGCGSDVAQTAFRPSVSPPFDCEPASEPVTLPSEPALGGGDSLSTSPLIGDTYGAGLGPGIALVARDGFRLYQNDELVAEDTASLVPKFVPLTFLPGDNVVSVVVSSRDRAPALLVHIDELERPYLSDAAWKVTTAPDGDFRSPGYDASGWDDAVDHGAGCEPAPGFVPGSGAHWIGTPDENARTAVFRLAIRIAPTGFGAATTGGEGTAPVLARDAEELALLLEDDAPGVILVPEGHLDFRRPVSEALIENACPLACDDGSGKITYVALSDLQTCDEPTRPIPRDERHLTLRSNKTVVGLGRGATLQGTWLSITDAENVILRNIAIYDVNPEIIEAGDGVGIERASRIWLDHVTFRWIGDGFVDVTDVMGQASDITLSWIHFDGNSEFACADHHPRANEISGASVTIHHSFYDHVTGRAPLANRAPARVHLFNNLVSDNPDYAVGAACGAEILLEESLFESVSFPTLRRDCPDDASLGKIFAPEGSNEYDASTGSHQLSGADSPEPRDMVVPPAYDYVLDDALDARDTVRDRAGAGAHWGLPFALDRRF